MGRLVCPGVCVCSMAIEKNFSSAIDYMVMWKFSIVMTQVISGQRVRSRAILSRAVSLYCTKVRPKLKVLWGGNGEVVSMGEVILSCPETPIRLHLQSVTLLVVSGKGM